MKLLHDFFRLRLAGLRGATFRADAGLSTFNETAPVPLAKPAAGEVVSVAPASGRREPASFLKAPRHLRLTTHR